jgi:hypothetical protein
MRGGGKLTRKPSLPPKSSEAKPHETPTTPVWKPPLPNPPSEAEQAKKEDTPTTGFNQPVSGWKVGCVVVSIVGIITLIYCCNSMTPDPLSTDAQSRLNHFVSNWNHEAPAAFEVSLGQLQVVKSSSNNVVFEIQAPDSDRQKAQMLAEILLGFYKKENITPGAMVYVKYGSQLIYLDAW